MLKRIFDFLSSFVLLLAFIPILLSISVLILVMLGRPVFFMQKRIGKNNKVFTMYKFRTMKAQKKGESLSDSERLTPFGRFMRATSLDELPELYNILKGEMSFVGPRPLLVEYLPLYNDVQIRRHEVMPGLTGWAQINGRNAISWEEKFAHDVWYVNNNSFWLDLKIIFKTAKKVFYREGISANNHATIEKFTGSKSS
ncbi:sugar transferase [Flocculibacter collagenilyticus]|uniref:sugar transferase n=1 Tax=Flocculibacter collagenilyticus TaxID=2744479 RepID=UPI0018F648CD|nr:sugar transferase [Flocculibacter collagenilyticus]